MILIRFEILPGVLMRLLPALCPTINFHSQQILDIQNVNSAAILSLSLSSLIFQSDNILLTKAGDTRDVCNSLLRAVTFI